MLSNFILISEFKRGIGSDHATNRATTTALI